MKVPFNWPYMTGKELHYIAQSHAGGHLAGDGPFTRRCSEWLVSNTGAMAALLTHSCTAALELAALLLDVKEGDEIIMPSYTFVSTANAFVLRGGVPVFVDIRPDTLNLDERLVESALTPRTRAIVPVHYAGVACEMDKIMDIAGRGGVAVVEDAAQGVMSSYRGRALGAIGDLGALSFHETKNVISGEGGALLITQGNYVARAEILREKGTDRSRFFRGQVDKYTWQDVGSSYLPSDLTAAFLWAQLEEAQILTGRRMSVWRAYHAALEPLERKGDLRRPVVPEGCTHNAHMYYILVREQPLRSRIIAELKKSQIGTVFHYVPLHSSPAGKRFGRAHGKLEVTDRVADTLVRLPLWIGMDETHVAYVVDAIKSFFAGLNR